MTMHSVHCPFLGRVYTSLARWPQYSPIDLFLALVSYFLLLVLGLWYFPFMSRVFPASL